MAIKKSVRLTSSVEKTLNTIAGSEPVNWSGTIRTLAEQFEVMVESLTKDMLTQEQWHAINLCVTSRKPHPDAAEDARMLPWYINQGYKQEEKVRQLLGEERDATQLSERIAAAEPAVKLAIMHKAKQFTAGRQG